MEWSDKNYLNSFNSEAKGLTFYENYKSINDWRLHKISKPLPPIEISLDPIHACNLHCSWCNASRYLEDKLEGRRMTDEHMMNLVKFLAKWGTKAICFTGDTKVKLVNGTHKTFEELTEDWNKNKRPFEVYSRDEKGNIVPGIAINPRKTQEVTELIELTLDNNEIIKCTLNHKFMLRDGSYKEAKDLTTQDSLMPLYTRVHYGYEIITDKTYQGTTHKLFSKYYHGNDDKIDSGELHTHHLNFNKLDNTKDNLKQLTESKHMSLHILTEDRKEKLRKNCFYRTVEGKEISKRRLISYNKSEKGRKKSGEIFSQWNKNNIEKCVERIKKYNNSEKGKRNSVLQFQKFNNSKAHLENNKNPEFILKRRMGKVNKVLKILEDNKLEFNFLNYTKYRFSYSPTWVTAIKILGYNHKIKSKKIIKLEKSISVYCLTVEKYHNFSLSAGVFVQNCWGGGGEPTLHTKLGEALELATSLGLENSIATNGTLFSDSLINIAVRNCRWIGVSIDAGTKDTYFEGRKIDMFDNALCKLFKLSSKQRELNTNCDVAYKFLIFKENQHEIYEACKLAKSLGVHTFHARPASYAHQGMKATIENPYNMELIEKQFEKCRELEDENFNVFLIVHKFNKDFSTKRNFKQCWAGPICIQLCADGNIYNCPDSRHLEYFKLGEHYPNPENIEKVWGSKRHYDLVFDGACKKCTWRCTFGHYANQFEKLFIDNNDSLCRNFV